LDGGLKFQEGVVWLTYIPDAMGCGASKASVVVKPEQSNPDQSGKK